MYRQIRIGPIKTSKIEIQQLFTAWVAVSAAFAIAMTPWGLLFTSKIIYAFILAAISVGTGFIFHEMGHKILAQKYGCFAEFRAFNQMLILAILLSFTGFIFAAPGAVMISGRIDRKKNGMISLMGPAINFALVPIFLFVFAISSGFLKDISKFGMLINCWIGIFNLIPFGNFDGIKIFKWNKIIYTITAVFGIALLIATQMIK